MLVVIFGESCTGKSTFAAKLASSLHAKVFTGKDYLRLEKNESSAMKAFQAILKNAVLGKNVIYVISERELLNLIPEGAVKVLVTADLKTIKERFAARMRGNLPPPVAAMLEKKHGSFDSEPCDFHLSSGSDIESLCKKILLHAQAIQLLLMRPTREYAEEIDAYREEFLASGDSMDGCGSLRRHCAEEWLEYNKILSKPETCPSNRVVSTQFICVRERDQKIVGMLQVRHYFNEYLEKYAGHIGYSVRPSERRKGYAKWMLKNVLPYCKSLGLEKVLVCCIDSNEASRKTILANHGAYDGTVYEPDEGVNLERYWIKTSE